MRRLKFLVETASFPGYRGGDGDGTGNSYGGSTNAANNAAATDSFSGGSTNYSGEYGLSGAYSSGSIGAQISGQDEGVASGDAAYATVADYLGPMNQTFSNIASGTAAGMEGYTSTRNEDGGWTVTNDITGETVTTDATGTAIAGSLDGFGVNPGDVSSISSDGDNTTTVTNINGKFSSITVNQVTGVTSITNSAGVKTDISAGMSKEQLEGLDLGVTTEGSALKAMGTIAGAIMAVPTMASAGILGLLGVAKTYQTLSSEDFQQDWDALTNVFENVSFDPSNWNAETLQAEINYATGGGEGTDLWSGEDRPTNGEPSASVQEEIRQAGLVDFEGGTPRWLDNYQQSIGDINTAYKNAVDAYSSVDRTFNGQEAQDLAKENILGFEDVVDMSKARMQIARGQLENFEAAWGNPLENYNKWFESVDPYQAQSLGQSEIKANFQELESQFKASSAGRGLTGSGIEASVMMNYDIAEAEALAANRANNMTQYAQYATNDASVRMNEATSRINTKSGLNTAYGNAITAYSNDVSNLATSRNYLGQLTNAEELFNIQQGITDTQYLNQLGIDAAQNTASAQYNAASLGNQYYGAQNNLSISNDSLAVQQRAIDSQEDSDKWQLGTQLLLGNNTSSGGSSLWDSVSGWFED